VNATSASPAEATASPLADPRRILVWDAPVRVFHWLAVLSFAGAWLTAESERWRLLHVTLGYTLAALVAFRLLWGLVGTRHARFASFVRRPSAVARYLGAMLRAKPERHTGHNPAGALAIVAMLGLAAAVSATGWALYQQTGGSWIEELHEGTANAMLALVIVHVAAVVFSSWLHRENLVGAMITGTKPGLPGDGIRRAWRSVAALILVAVVGFWWVQWTSPAPDGLLKGAQVTAGKGPDDRHDDGD
jgi:cytochrome b